MSPDPAVEQLDRARYQSSALRSAFEAQVALLFRVLCDGHGDDLAPNRFRHGFAIAAKAYETELERIDGSPPAP